VQQPQQHQRQQAQDAKTLHRQQQGQQQQGQQGQQGQGQVPAAGERHQEQAAQAAQAEEVEEVEEVDHGEFTCIICCGSSSAVAVTPCGHHEVCAQCTLRLRLCYKDSHCPLCKQVRGEGWAWPAWVGVVQGGAGACGPSPVSYCV
jgi:hypothetical protein